MASFVSKAFTAEVFEPSGKPMTVQTLTLLPFSSWAARATFTGFTHTLAEPISFASAHSFLICSGVAVALSKV